MSTAKSFLLRASNKVTAAFSNFAQLEKDGCNLKAIAALKHLASKASLVHAQYEEAQGTLQFNLNPESDSEVDYSSKIFSVPTMMEIANFLKAVSSAEGYNAAETYLDKGVISLTVAVCVAVDGSFHSPIPLTLTRVIHNELSRKADK